MTKKKSTGKTSDALPPTFIDKHFNDEMENVYDDLFHDETMVEMAGMVGRLVNDQCQTAVDLTRIIVEHQKPHTLTEAQILAVYQRAMKMITQDSPMKSLLDELN